MTIIDPGGVDLSELVRTGASGDALFPLPSGSDSVLSLQPGEYTWLQSGSSFLTPATWGSPVTHDSVGGLINVVSSGYTNRIARGGTGSLWMVVRAHDPSQRPRIVGALSSMTGLPDHPIDYMAALIEIAKAPSPAATDGPNHVVQNWLFQDLEFDRVVFRLGRVTTDRANATAATNIVFRNCRFKNAYPHFFQVQWAINLLFENCVFEFSHSNSGFARSRASGLIEPFNTDNLDAHGIFLQYLCRNVRLQSCCFVNIGGDALHVGKTQPTGDWHLQESKRGIRCRDSLFVVDLSTVPPPADYGYDNPSFYTVPNINIQERGGQLAFVRYGEGHIDNKTNHEGGDYENCAFYGSNAGWGGDAQIGASGTATPAVFDIHLATREIDVWYCYAETNGAGLKVALSQTEINQYGIGGICLRDNRVVGNHWNENLRTVSLGGQTSMTSPVWHSGYGLYLGWNSILDGVDYKRGLQVRGNVFEGTVSALRVRDPASGLVRNQPAIFQGNRFVSTRQINLSGADTYHAPDELGGNIYIGTALNVPVKWRSGTDAVYDTLPPKVKDCLLLCEDTGDPAAVRLRDLLRDWGFSCDFYSVSAWYDQFATREAALQALGLSYEFCLIYLDRRADAPVPSTPSWYNLLVPSLASCPIAVCGTFPADLFALYVDEPRSVTFGSYRSAWGGVSDYVRTVETTFAISDYNTDSAPLPARGYQVEFPCGARWWTTTAPFRRTDGTRRLAKLKPGTNLLDSTNKMPSYYCNMPELIYSTSRRDYRHKPMMEAVTSVSSPGAVAAWRYGNVYGIPLEVEANKLRGGMFLLWFFGQVPFIRSKHPHLTMSYALSEPVVESDIGTESSRRTAELETLQSLTTPLCPTLLLKLSQYRDANNHADAVSSGTGAATHNLILEGVGQRWFIGFTDPTVPGQEYPAWQPPTGDTIHTDFTVASDIDRIYASAQVELRAMGMPQMESVTWMLPTGTDITGTEFTAYTRSHGKSDRVIYLLPTPTRMMSLGRHAIASYRVMPIGWRGLVTGENGAAHSAQDVLSSIYAWEDL